jgi:hypothetical protein
LGLEGESSFFELGSWGRGEGKNPTLWGHWGYLRADHGKSLCIQLTFFHPFRMVSQIKEELDVRDLHSFSFFSID